MTRRKIPKLEPGELPYNKRVTLTIKEYQRLLRSKRDASLRNVVLRYNVYQETIRDYINRAMLREEFAAARQRLSPSKEKVLEGYVK